MTDHEISMLPPKMQEAVHFIQYWQMARDLSEFLSVMGRPVDDKTKLWASNMATKFRKNGVGLRRLSDKTGMDPDLDWSYLQVISDRALAALARRKEEAEDVTKSMAVIREEALHILRELRKYKDLIVDRERLAEYTSPNGGH